MSWVIRPYQPDDLTGCLSVIESNTPQYFDASEFEEFKQDLLQRETLPAHKQWPYFVLVTNNIVRGCGGYFVKGESTAGLIWGMLHSDDHGKRLGTALLSYRIRCLPKQIAIVELDTTPAAFGFFEKNGFIKDGVEKEGYGPGLDKVLAHLNINR